MIKRIAGYIIVVIGGLGYLYFKSYTGSLIPLPFLWEIVSILISIVGAYLVITSLTRKQKKIYNDHRNEISKLKENGERIILDFDLCDFKTNNFQEEVGTDNYSRSKMIDGLYDSSRNYKTVTINKTVIIYHNKIGDRVEKYFSQPFATDEMTLKFYVSNKQVYLYIDRFDRKKYFFEIEK